MRKIITAAGRVAATAATVGGLCIALGVTASAQGTSPPAKPNILVIMGDDIGYWNISAYNRGMMGYHTPNIDRIANEGAIFTDYYGQQSCTAGRAAFITGQTPIRTGLLKVGLAGARKGAVGQGPDAGRTAEAAWATRPASSARTISATATSSCRPCTGSMSSSATSIT